MSSNDRETSCPNGNSWKHSGGKACLYYGVRLELRASARGSGLPGIQNLTYLRQLVSCRPWTNPREELLTAAPNTTLQSSESRLGWQSEVACGCGCRWDMAKMAAYSKGAVGQAVSSIE